MAKSEEELKILLTKVKEESEKAGLKFNSQKTKIKASGSITSWQIKEEKVETETDFIFLGSKITVDSACSHEIKTHLKKKKKKKDTCSLKVSKKYVKKQRHNFVHKVSYSQSYGFSSSHVWMRELDHKEGWVLKNWCFQIVVQEKTLKVPWTARRSNQSILKEINPEYLLEGLILKLKLQYFGHLMERADSLEKILMLEKIEGKGEGSSREWNG